MNGNPEKNETKKITSCSDEELLRQPELLKVGRRVFVKNIGGREASGIIGLITGFESKTGILFLSSFDGREEYSVQLNKNIEVTFY